MSIAAARARETWLRAKSLLKGGDKEPVSVQDGRMNNRLTLTLQIRGISL
jgi:hypothetical protein